MPRILVIDTATPACSVALFEDGHMLGGDFRLLGRGHAEHIVGMIAALPNQGKAQHIFVNCGPGSFTGIRVGLAAAKALAMAWAAKLSGYNGLQLSALMAAEQNSEAIGDAKIFIANIAGHGEIFGQLFDKNGAILSKLHTLPPLAMRRHINAQIIAGTAMDLLAEHNGHMLYPDARAFPAQHINKIMPLDAKPVYGRAPDAKAIVNTPDMSVILPSHP